MPAAVIRSSPCHSELSASHISCFSERGGEPGWIRPEFQARGVRSVKISEAAIGIRGNDSRAGSKNILVAHRTALSLSRLGASEWSEAPTDSVSKSASSSSGRNALCGAGKLPGKAAAYSESRRWDVQHSRTTSPWRFLGSQRTTSAREHVGFRFRHSTRTTLRGRGISGLQENPSATFCSTAVGSVSRAGSSSAVTTMELFKPQLVERVPLQFLSEYHAKPRVGPAPAVAAARRDSMNPVCLFGMGQQTKPVVEIVQAGDPVLREPAAEVQKEEIGSARIEKIINDMVATMRNAPGVGLAAPQIGIPLQIIVLEDTREYMRSLSQEECDEQQRYPFDLLVIVNPKLKVKSGSGQAIFFEGCLSVNGYRALLERQLEVEVTGLGRDGRPISVEASGWKARILQHECDHLAGNLYVDKMISRSFRTQDQLRLPLPSGCPSPGVCKPSKKVFIK